MNITNTVNPIVTLAAAFALSSPLCGQRAAVTPSHLEGWLPRAIAKDEITRISAADRTIIEANLAVAEALVTKISRYAVARGFEVGRSWVYDTPRSRDTLSNYRLTIWTYVPSRAADPDGRGGLDITFNPNVAQICEPALITEESGERIYIERPRVAPVHGAAITYGVFDQTNREGLFVLYTSGGQSPMLPVTREQYLRSTIFALEGKDQAKLKEFRAGVAQTPYEKWMAAAAQRTKDNEAVLATIPDKALAAKTRAEMEKGEREMTEALKKDEPNFRAMVNEGVKSATAAGDMIRAQIAAMTDAERASPAWVQGTKLVPAGTLEAHAVVRTNPAFYRARRSPVEPRAILIHLPNLPAVVMPAQRQLNDEFDWAALKRLLDERP